MLRLLMRMLVWMAERIVVLEMWWHMMAECRQIHHRASMQTIIGGRQGERCAQAHAHSHSRRMEVACLVVVQGVRASRGGSIVSRRLVRKCGEGEGIWVEERRGKAPWFMLRSRRRIEIF